MRRAAFAAAAPQRRAPCGAPLTDPVPEFVSRFTPPKTRSKWTSRLKCNGACGTPSRGRLSEALAPPAYYYRVNYFGLVVLCFCVSFLRNPLAFFAIAAASFATLCLNDSFAHTVRRAPRPAASQPLTPAQRPGGAHHAQDTSAALRLPPQPDGHRVRPLGLIDAPASRAPCRTTAGSRAYARSKVVYLLGQDRRVVLSAWFAISSASLPPLAPSLLTAASSVLLIMLTGAMRTLARTLAVSLGSVLLHASLRSPNLKARLNSYNEEFRAIWRSSYAEA